MKVAVQCLCVFGLVFGFANAAPTEEQMAKINTAIENCKPKTGATDDDLAALMKHEIPTTQTGQCFVACMNKELGLMTADNKIDVAHIKELGAAMKDKDAEKYEKGIKVIETCAEEVKSQDNECTVAKMMMECCKKEAAAVGLKLEDFMED